MFKNDSKIVYCTHLLSKADSLQRLLRAALELVRGGGDAGAVRGARAHGGRAQLAPVRLHRAPVLVRPRADLVLYPGGLRLFVINTCFRV